MSSAKSLTDKILREMKSAWPNVPMDADRVSLWNRILNKFITERGERDVLKAWEEIVMNAKYPIAPADFAAYLPKPKNEGVTKDEIAKAREEWEREKDSPEYKAAMNELAAVAKKHGINLVGPWEKSRTRRDD